MSPLVFVSVTSQPPPPIVPVSESALRAPVVVRGSALWTLPKEVRALTLKPAPPGRASLMGAKEVVGRVPQQVPGHALHPASVYRS